jgi:hypothetical protein
MSEKPWFFGELKRRNVYKVAVAYAVVDPVWDLIRDDPGFQELLAGKQLVGPGN